MNPAEAYLAELRDIRASGAAVPETSGYGALANLLNEVGAKPVSYTHLTLPTNREV